MTKEANMNIIMQGKYQTRGNAEYPSRPVRILAVDLKSQTPVVGVLADSLDQVEHPWVWTADGKWGGIHDRQSNYYECYDLVPIPLRKRKNWWQRNMYGPACDIYPDRERRTKHR